jgi:hypothetical protein
MKLLQTNVYNNKKNMYIIDLYNDFVIWYKYAKVTKSNKSKLAENNLRVDWLGRIYTVINVPDELKNYPNIEMWVMQQLGPFNKILIELGIADYSFPEVSKIEDPGVNAYLVVMYPELNNIDIWRIILEIAKWAGIFVLLRVLYKLCLDYNIFNALYKIVSQYV